MISRQSLSIMLNNAVGSFLGFASMFLILRYMGAEALGIVAFGMGFAGLFSSITNLGTNSAHVKRISEGRNEPDCVATYILIKFVLTSIYGVIVLFSLYVWTDILGNGFESDLQRYSIYIFTIYWIFFSLSNIFITTFMGRREMVKAQIPNFVNNVSRFLLIVFVALFSLGTVTLMWSYTIAMFIGFIAGMLLFHGTRIGKVSRTDIRSYYSFALPLALSSSVTVIAANFDAVIIQYFWGALEVSYFFAAQKIWLMMRSVGIAVATSLFPFISKMHKKGDIGVIRTSSRLAERYISLITTPLALFIITFSVSVVHVLLSDALLPAIPVIRVMTLAGLLGAVNYPYVYLIMGMDRSDISGKILSLRGGLNIVLSFVLVSSVIFGVRLFGLGPFGSGLALLLSLVVAGSIERIISWRLARVLPETDVLKHLIAALLTSILFLQIDTSWATRWYTLSILGILYLGLYSLILYLIGGLKKEDIDLILDTLNPFKMFRYISDEVRGK